MIKRLLQRISVFVCTMVMVVAIFLGCAFIAGGLGADKVSEKILWSTLAFVGAIFMLIVAYLIDGRDTEKMLDDLLLGYLIAK